MLMAPGNMNIRRRGFSKPPKIEYGYPTVYGGDWMSERDSYGLGPRLVYYRRPWIGGPLVRRKAMGSLGWNEYPPSSSTRDCGLTNPGHPQRICAVERGTIATAWRDDMGYVNNPANGCVRQGNSCTTRMGNDGVTYCCGGPATQQTSSQQPSRKQGVISSIANAVGWGVGEGGGDTIVVGSGADSIACRRLPERSGGSSYWRQVQTRLCHIGYDPGRIDGVVGTNTRSGIRAFQTANGLQATGRVDAATASRLGVSVETGQSSGASSSSSTSGRSGAATDSRDAGTQPSFFRVNNPTLWLGLAGVLLVGGGVAYAVKSSKKDKSVDEISDSLASLKARLGS